MTKQKKIVLVIISLLVLAGIWDAVYYLKPSPVQKKRVQVERMLPASGIKELILVYNAYGGIYPSIADFMHKIISPSTYPCNLCYQTFGVFSMKQEWEQYLDSLPYQKTFLHKEQFTRSYQPNELPLPAILVSDENNIAVLASASEINACKTLDSLKELVNEKLTR